MIADFNSPTTDILSALQPFTPGRGTGLSRPLVDRVWLCTYPTEQAAGLSSVNPAGSRIAPGRGRSSGQSRSASGPDTRFAIEAKLGLILALALATLVGEAVISAFSTNLFGTRNLAAAWPGCALLVGALGDEFEHGAPSGLPPHMFVLAAFAIGAVKMLEQERAAARLRRTGTMP